MTIKSSVSFELEIRRSRFLSFLEPVANKEQALALVEKYRGLHRDAAHHCYAWRLGTSGLQYRMSDDGEPSGTAGKPMLFTLQQAALCDTIAIVVRYFGGIKLGIGPLARAYADAVRGTIAVASLEPIVTKSHYRVHCLYEDVSKILPLLEDVDAVFETNYSDTVTFDVFVPETNEVFFLEGVVERTNARAGFSKITAEGE